MVVGGQAWRLGRVAAAALSPRLSRGRLPSQAVPLPGWEVSAVWWCSHSQDETLGLVSSHLNSKTTGDVALFQGRHGNFCVISAALGLGV